MTLETYVAGLLVGGFTSHCRLCLQSPGEQTLGDSAIYSNVIQRILSFKKCPIPSTARLCAACRALLRRCARILDALVQSHKLAVIAAAKPPRRNNIGHFVVADNDLVEGYRETVRLRESACKLCITETLSIDSQLSGPPEPPTGVPGTNLTGTNVTGTNLTGTNLVGANLTGTNLTGIGNNIILVPAYGNQVMQLGGGASGTLQLVNPVQMLQQVGNTVQLVQVPTSTTHTQPADTQGTASQPTQHVAKRKLDEVGAEGLAFGGGGTVRRVEDEECIAYIETDIYSAEGASEGLCIVPDETPVPVAVVSAKRESVGADCKPGSKGKRLRKLLMRVGDVIDLDSDEDERTGARPTAGARRPASERPGGTWAPQPVRDKDVDWEDQIPMEVITYANEHPGRRPTSNEQSPHGFGQIVSVHSESEICSAVKSIRPEGDRRSSRLSHTHQSVYPSPSV